ncbi:BPSL0761 family protein [Cognatilysobacter segetis]|uniref:BPSL0761 family protein n=1 Tax=Cognatilysobacter segetis TaxID=2492394 RepID=UPI00192E364F|nr:BPSL0761 family protein [Lysobacter segetis]
MTMPDERTRALLCAGSFLIEIARDTSLPLGVRRQAVFIARHFPTIEDIASMAAPRHTALFGPQLAHPSEVHWREDGRPGPLTYSTRLAWPEEEKPKRSRRTTVARPNRRRSLGESLDD